MAMSHRSCVFFGKGCTTQVVEWTFDTAGIEFVPSFANTRDHLNPPTTTPLLLEPIIATACNRDTPKAPSLETKRSANMCCKTIKLVLLLLLLLPAVATARVMASSPSTGIADAVDGYSAAQPMSFLDELTEASQNIFDQDRLLRRNVLCRHEAENDVCVYQARLDGNALELITYCPTNSSDVADCNCTVTHDSESCTSCSFCHDTRVFVVDCDNVITNGACASVDCYGTCLTEGVTPWSQRRSGNGRLSHDAVAAVVVFSSMCFLPCFAALICARLLPSNANEPPTNSNSYFGGIRERKKVIEKCLLTKVCLLSIVPCLLMCLFPF